MIRPVDAPLGQGFGENPTSALPAGHWILKQFGNYQPDGHAGEDYPCPVGTPIRAVTSGTVLHVGFYGGTYRDNPYWIAPNFAGYCYVIDHGAFIGIYAHGMDQGARVSVGQHVSEGQVIGLSGNTGGSTGPHLHFEILPDKFIVNSGMYGRTDPEALFTSGLAAMGGTITPAEQPKEWDEMASQDDIRAVVREEIRNGDAGRILGYYNWTETPVKGWNGEVSAAARLAGTDQAVNDIRAQLGAQNGMIAGLIGALAAVNKGEPFDQAKLLAGVQSAAESGVKNAIESITVTIKEN